MVGLGPAEILILLILCSMSIIPIFFLWRILQKAGYQGAYALLGLFPPLLLVILGFLAFAEWPNDHPRNA